MPRAIFVSRDKPVMQPHEVRALRDEFGWTQEQLAGAAGVSPLEVSAWEAGAVFVRLDDAARLEGAAHRERRERAWDAADARPCAWGADARARLERAGEDIDFELSEELDKHEKQCAECGRAATVERSLPKSGLPLPASVGGFLAFVLRTPAVSERLPAPLKVAVELAIAGGRLMLLTLVLAFLRFIVEPSAGFHPSPTLVLQIAAVFMIWVGAGALWSEVYPAQTSLARFLKAATTAAVVAVMALLGMDSMEQSDIVLGVWMAVLMVRDHWGRKDADAQPEQQNALAAPDPRPGALPGSGVEPHVEPIARDPVPAARSTG